MPKWCDEPSPSDWVRVEDRVANGAAPFHAARAEGFTLSALKRSDRVRHAALLDAGRTEQGERAIDNLKAIGANHEHPQAVRANELVAKDAGRIQETSRLEVGGIEGAPIAVEGRAVVGLADVVRLARELGQGHLVGLDAGDSHRELPAAEDLLPDPGDGERPASALSDA